MPPARVKLCRLLVLAFILGAIMLFIAIRQDGLSRPLLGDTADSDKLLKMMLGRLQLVDGILHDDFGRKLIPIDMVVESLDRLDLSTAQGHSPRIRATRNTSESNNYGSTAVLVLACNRPTVRRALEHIFRYKPSDNYPVIVSQDCDHKETSDAISFFGDRVLHIRQPELSDPSYERGHENYINYYKISRHYKWALTQVFDILMFEQAIIIEDDMEVAPDFFDYFNAFLPVLRRDESLLCVSAWNDNGKKGMAENPHGFFRSDFFPGLGWMITRNLWNELKPKWPATFWDDWLRLPEQRKGRACIRPEVSRNINFGREGVSVGQYFEEHIAKQPQSVWPEMFSKLEYDITFDTQVYKHSTRVTSDQLRTLLALKDLAEAPAYRDNANLFESDDAYNAALNPASTHYCGPQCIRRYVMLYNRRGEHGYDEFVPLAQQWGLMDDIRAGVARTSYHGVVCFKAELKHPQPYVVNVNGKQVIVRDKLEKYKKIVAHEWTTNRNAELNQGHFLTFLFNMLTALSGLFALITATYGGYTDPKIVTPINGTMWRVGNRELISWDPTWRRPDGQYYSNKTRVTVALFDSGKRIATIVEHFPFTIGSIYWTVPESVVPDASTNESVAIGDENQARYRLMIYPTYFDWPSLCRGCMKSAPAGGDFTIVHANCTGLCDELAPIRPGFGVSGDRWGRDYSVAVRSVAIGVGVVAAIVFAAALFVYTKKGSKAWKKYQRRRSGLVYKYKTPAARVQRASTSTSLDQDSPLKKFFSTDDPTPNPPSPTRYESLLNIHSAGEQSSLPTSIPPPQGLPPVPPVVYAPALETISVSPVSSGHNAYLHPDPPGIPPPLPAHLGYPGVMLSSTQALRSQTSNAAINQSDALLVGNTFRNVLRVNNSEDSDSAAGSLSSVGQVQIAGTLPNSSFGCSPVLSQLGWVEEQEKTEHE